MVISELMLNPQFQDIILKMHWWVVDFSTAGISLITCDQPYMIFNTIRHPECLIYLPLGPTLGFYASLVPTKQHLKLDLRLEARDMNRCEAALAAQYIYAADRRAQALRRSGYDRPSCRSACSRDIERRSGRQRRPKA
jgi:hypothetical protein